MWSRQVATQQSGDRSPDSKNALAEALPNLLCAEGADAVEPEAKQHALLLSHTYVIRVVLRRHRAAIPIVTDGHSGADERTISLPGSRLIIKEERGAAEESAFAVAQKDRRTPLRT